MNVDEGGLVHELREDVGVEGPTDPLVGTICGRTIDRGDLSLTGKPLTCGACITRHREMITGTLCRHCGHGEKQHLAGPPTVVAKGNAVLMLWSAMEANDLEEADRIKTMYGIRGPGDPGYGTRIGACLIEGCHCLRFEAWELEG